MLNNNFDVKYFKTLFNSSEIAGLDYLKTFYKDNKNLEKVIDYNQTVSWGEIDIDFLEYIQKTYNEKETYFDKLVDKYNILKVKLFEELELSHLLESEVE